MRVALLIQYFFYKNVAAFTAQVYFAFINQYSTQTLYDSVCLANFNMVYTALPVFLLGLFEQVQNCRIPLSIDETFYYIKERGLFRGIL